MESSRDDALADDARWIDTYLRAEIAAGRIKKFSLLVRARHPSGGPSASGQVDTYADVIRADGKGHTIRLSGASRAQFAESLAQPRARVVFHDREHLRAEHAHAREPKPPWLHDLDAVAMSVLLRDLERAVFEAARKAELGYESAAVEAAVVDTVRFVSDHRTPLARYDETCLELRCDLRFRDSPPPRLYGEDHEPAGNRVRTATLVSASRPDEHALADLVARAAAAPTF